MTTLISPDGREYRTSNLLEERRLVLAFGYKVKDAEVPKAFDPAEHSVKEVVAYIKDHPADADRVRDAELAGEARKSIVGD